MDYVNCRLASTGNLRYNKNGFGCTEPADFVSVHEE